ncbi:MAG: AgmX/PglI C-terminal domain-containing protein [Pseudomonadales bacterium]|nr:AgmX/PglI C-terminal domain-containing protein [Pseudomonadales bacterium]
MSQTLYYSTVGLPWDRTAEDETRFRKVVACFLIFFVAFVMIVPNIPVPEKKRDQVETIPPRLAKLVMEKKKPPPPPPKKEEKKEEEKPKEEKKKEEKKKEEKKPDKKKTAKEKAKAAIAVFDDLADLRDQEDLSKLKQEQKTAQLGNSPDPTKRSLLTSMAAGGSGGVAVSKASSGGGGTGTLAGAVTTQVESSIEDPAAEQSRRRGKDGKARRTTEDIQLVFDRHKGSIYSLYRRALRKNPALEGTLVLRLVIQPSGEVTKCEVVSSELEDSALERKIVLKIKRINFGAMDVDVWDDTYPIDFIPS